MNDADAPYDAAFFEGHLQGSIESARAILPLVLDLVHVESAVDVGCGVGAWLFVLSELGVGDVLGIDGSYVERSRLLIPEKSFLAHDLTTDPRLDRSFDLALSLEVAEHLPAERARGFVALLTSLAPAVLFSAAAPGQGGTGHLNERWPSYWVELFAERGYAVIDTIRGRVWALDGVAPWYAQNSLLLASEQAVAASGRLREAIAACRGRPLDVVHPRTFEIYQRNWLPPAGYLLRRMPVAVAHSLGLAGTRARLAERLSRRRSRR